MTRIEAGCSSTQVDDFNTALHHPAIRCTLRCLAHHNAKFRSFDFIKAMMSSYAYPSITISDILKSATKSDAPLIACAMDLSEAALIKPPFLVHIRQSSYCNSNFIICEVERMGKDFVDIFDINAGVIRIDIKEFAIRWSGIVITVNVNISNSFQLNESDLYRGRVNLIPRLISPDDCKYLINYCEITGFSDSSVLRTIDGLPETAVMKEIRSSSSVVLHDRNDAIISRIYTLCAMIEGVVETQIETIQCVRYSSGQLFVPHFDGGVGLPRQSTYLLYLNSDFSGGETNFPMLNISISPQTGYCLRFPSCNPDGQVIWLSEHAGLPVNSGTKYALNIWVKCP